VLGRHRQERARVGNGGVDLGAVAHDAGVAQQPPHVARVEARDLPGIEAGERAPVRRAFFQDRDPRQPRLRAFQQEELEEPAVLTDGDAPLAVVIDDVERIAGPEAAGRLGARHGGRDRIIRRPRRPGSG